MKITQTVTSILLLCWALVVPAASPFIMPLIMGSLHVLNETAPPCSTAGAGTGALPCVQTRDGETTIRYHGYITWNRRTEYIVFENYNGAAHFFTIRPRGGALERVTRQPIDEYCAWSNQARLNNGIVNVNSPPSTCTDEPSPPEPPRVVDGETPLPEPIRPDPQDVQDPIVNNPPQEPTCQAVNDNPCEHPSPCMQAYCRAKRSCESLFGGGQGFTNQNLTQYAGLAMMIQQSMRQDQGAAEACKGQRNASAIIATLSGTYMTACATARSACISQCDDEADELITGSGPNCSGLRREVRTAKSTCQGYEQQQQQAQQQTLQGAMGAAMAQACADQAEDQQGAMAQFCAQNPTLIECGGDGSVDCNNPRNQRLLQCLCRDPDQQRTNPACNPNNVAGGTQNNTVSAVDGAFNDPFAGMGGVGSLDTLLGLQDPEAGGNFANQPTDGGNAMNSNRGAGPQQGNGNSGAAPGARAATAASGPTAPDLGLSGGGGGAPSFASGGTRGAGNGRGEARELASPDMSKLLAGLIPAQTKSRELAGMSIPAKDGITGPLGPSIWEKISGAYMRVGPRLLP